MHRRSARRRGRCMNFRDERNQGNRNRGLATDASARRCMADQPKARAAECDSEMNPTRATWIGAWQKLPPARIETSRAVHCSGAFGRRCSSNTESRLTSARIAARIRQIRGAAPVGLRPRSLPARPACTARSGRWVCSARRGLEGVLHGKAGHPAATWAEKQTHDGTLQIVVHFILLYKVLCFQRLT